MSDIQQVIVQLSWREPLARAPRPQHLRGAIANAFRDDPRFHQHGPDGVIYRYPLIQYRCHGNQTYLVGFQEGAETLLQLPLPGLQLRLGSHHNEIIDAKAYPQTSRVEKADVLQVETRDLPWKRAAPSQTASIASLTTSSASGRRRTCRRT